MSEFQGLYNVRDIKVGDENFIISTFLRGLYYGDSWFSQIPKSIFMDCYKVAAERLIKHATIKIACLPDEEDIIIGYSILSNDYTTVHWVYVKKDWRKQGIATSLVPKYASYVTHLTALGKELLPKLKDAVFHPFKN